MPLRKVAVSGSGSELYELSVCQLAGFDYFENRSSW